MWVVIVCGGVLAMSSSRIAISVDADGVVAGSAQPGMLMMIMGFLACVCLVAGGAVKRFRPLHSSSGEQTTENRLHPLIVFGRAVLAVLLAVCIGIQCWYGLVRHQDEDWAFPKTACPWSPLITWRPVPTIVCRERSRHAIRSITR